MAVVDMSRFCAWCVYESFGFLVLVGGLWPLSFFAHCVLLYRISGFLGVEEIFPGSLGVFFGRSIYESYEFTGFLLGSIPLAVGCPFIRLWERTTKRNVKQ
jgi:hypothetical protein